MAVVVVVDRGDVVVTVSDEDAERRRDLQTNGYGVAELPKCGECVGAVKRRRLALPEAYYAAAIDGVLPATEPLLELWQQFSSCNSRFPKQYAVYHHFRQLGWMLKPGLNYGAHYVLYRGSAAEFHSEYVVYVHEDAETLSWQTIQSLTRIATDVKKTVLVCTVDIAQVSAITSTTSAESSVIDAERESELTFGAYCFHGAEYTVEAVAIRFWDPSTDDGQSYSFQQQPVLLKKVKKAKGMNKVKRSKRQVEAEVGIGTEELIPPR